MCRGQERERYRLLSQEAKVVELEEGCSFWSFFIATL